MIQKRPDQMWSIGSPAKRLRFKARIRQAMPLAFIVMLSACRPELACQPLLPNLPSGDAARLVDKSLLTGEPCAAPCWQGLTPGESATLDDVVTALENTPFVASTYTHSDGDTYVYWTSALTDLSGTAGEVYIKSNGQISYIFVKHLEYDLTIQELIDTIGEPDWIHAISLDTPEGIGPPPPTCYGIEFIWLKEGLRAMLSHVSEEQAAETGQLITSETRIVSVFYFPPVHNLDEYLRQLGSSPESSYYYQEWESFEEIAPR